LVEIIGGLRMPPPPPPVEGGGPIPDVIDPKDVDDSVRLRWNPVGGGNSGGDMAPWIDPAADGEASGTVLGRRDSPCAASLSRNSTNRLEKD
jgi:hypothetical protein